MLEHLRDFPTMLREALELPLLNAPPRPSRFLVGGMGGSSIASEILAGFWRATGGPELIAIRDYSLPPSREGDLFLACSYSGNTEETLSLYSEAHKRNLPRFGMCSGGMLAENLREEGLLQIPLPEGKPPRATLPYMLGRLLRLSGEWELGLSQEAIEDLYESLSETLDLCHPDRPLRENPAKKAAERLGEYRPVLVALSPAYEAVATRLRGQFEENAKRSSLSRSLPELHHNSWIPWTGDPDPPGAALWIGESDAHSRTLLRRELSEEILEERTLPAINIPSYGHFLFSRLLTSVLFGDFITVYHALMRGEEPTHVRPLSAMKERLSKSGKQEL